MNSTSARRQASGAHRREPFDHEDAEHSRTWSVVVQPSNARRADTSPLTTGVAMREYRQHAPLPDSPKLRTHLGPRAGRRSGGYRALRGSGSVPSTLPGGRSYVYRLGPCVAAHCRRLPRRTSHEPKRADSHTGSSDLMLVGARISATSGGRPSSLLCSFPRLRRPGARCSLVYVRWILIRVPM